MHQILHHLQRRILIRFQIINESCRGQKFGRLNSTYVHAHTVNHCRETNEGSALIMTALRYPVWCLIFHLSHQAWSVCGIWTCAHGCKCVKLLLFLKGCLLLKTPCCNSCSSSRHTNAFYHVHTCFSASIQLLLIVYVLLCMFSVVIRQNLGLWTLFVLWESIRTYHQAKHQGQVVFDSPFALYTAHRKWNYCWCLIMNQLCIDVYQWKHMNICYTNHCPCLLLSFGPKLGNNNLLCAWLERSVMAAQAWRPPLGKLVPESLTNVSGFLFVHFHDFSMFLCISCMLHHYHHTLSNLSFLRCICCNLETFDNKQELVQFSFVELVGLVVSLELLKSVELSLVVVSVLFLFKSSMSRCCWAETVQLIQMMPSHAILAWR